MSEYGVLAEYLLWMNSLLYDQRLLLLDRRIKLIIPPLNKPCVMEL
ncbi:hypothetical protein SAMN02746065_10894 [Desulfocicer vacuolatum DSM 3385]|uniref:Uncharacterized protein n=1 Tax=Desulfocicer vacuolatum DSM 3385 TaxID=1121400 RepID=A0A1W2BHY8_9BACT|nr:hypothetical protein SAMN02746065_10894 [Desulfocicer vacuolatum DSM 3385]